MRGSAALALVGSVLLSGCNTSQGWSQQARNAWHRKALKCCWPWRNCARHKGESPTHWLP